MEVSPTKEDLDNQTLKTVKEVVEVVAEEAKVVLLIMIEQSKKAKKEKEEIVDAVNAVVAEEEVKTVEKAVKAVEEENAVKEEMENAAEVAEAKTDPELKVKTDPISIVLKLEPEKWKRDDSKENLVKIITLWTNTQELDVANAIKESQVVAVVNGEMPRMMTRKPKK